MNVPIGILKKKFAKYEENSLNILLSPCNENLTQHVSLSHWCQIHQFGFSNCMYCCTCTTICLSMPVWCTCTINYLSLSINLSVVSHLCIILSVVFHLSIRCISSAYHFVFCISSVYHCCIFICLSLCLLYFSSIIIVSVVFHLSL